MNTEELETIAAREMARYGLQGWTFALADTRRRLGACLYGKKRIEIAAYHAANSPAESVLDTLRHEIAHALAGPAAGHGPLWKAIAVRLGATPRACEVSPEIPIKPGAWQATCPTCSRTVHLYRRPRSLAGYYCTCAARSPIVFEFMGDPARRPQVPLTPQESARWEATCAGCGTMHLRYRRPKAGHWRCGCPQRGELIWRPRNSGGMS
jgi:predicted SprT family Zn-dependent metalloprotease